jgi:hypothetical protein
VSAYTDDVSNFLTSPADNPKVRDVIGCHEKASGPTINIIKSKIIALGTWDTRLNILDVPYKDTLSILVMKLSKSIALSSNASWAQTTDKIEAKAQKDYSRILTFDKKVKFVHEQLYARTRIHLASRGSLTSQWLSKWNLITQTQNPPNVDGLPAHLDYIR